MAADIRLARADDVDALVAVENAAFETDRISARSYRHLIRSPSAVVLLADGCDRCDGASVVLFRAGSRVARLYSIASTASAVPGTGRALLAAAEAAARTRAEVLRLEVRHDNVRAIALYERNGYRRTGRTEGYYADGAAALRYEKALPSASRSVRTGTASS